MSTGRHLFLVSLVAVTLPVAVPLATASATTVSDHSSCAPLFNPQPDPPGRSARPSTGASPAPQLNPQPLPPGAPLARHPWS
jgi:hypothetical protein